MDDPDRILLVTVNARETAAILAAFKVATGAEVKLEPIEKRVYRDLGSLGSTRIFHALSEMGSSSPGSSQLTVDKAIRALKPTLVVAVGIAFGVDESKQKIGDILVSRQLTLYELQRVGKDVTISRGDRVHASTRLVNLFEGVAQASWQGAEVSVGIILSGEKLVDNLDYRAQLLKVEPEAIGGEMEGAGVYVSSQEHKIDWIVVKAICDWADGEKKENKTQRQTTAATSAAAFVTHALTSVFKTSVRALSDSSVSTGSIAAPTSAPLALRAVEYLEQLSEAVMKYQLMFSNYSNFVLNKVPEVPSKFEIERLELDNTIVNLAGKLQIYIPVELGRVISRIRRIVSCSWQKPLFVYSSLQQAANDFPRAPIEAGSAMLDDLIKCFIEMTFEINQGMLGHASYLSLLNKHNLDAYANPLDHSVIARVARVVMLEHEYLESDWFDALEAYASYVNGKSDE